MIRGDMVNYNKMNQRLFAFTIYLIGCISFNWLAQKQNMQADYK